MRPKVVALHALATQHNIPLSALCLNFALNQPHVQEVIVGVDGLDHLKENVGALRFKGAVLKIMPQLTALKEDDEEIILIPNWKKPWKKN